MIIRVVKMTFASEKVNSFLEMFDRKKELIRAFNGCERLELLGDVNNAQIYFTYSFWKSEENLNEYRYSELFKETWAETKAMFSDKPEAWSLNQKHVLI